MKSNLISLFFCISLLFSDTWEGYTIFTPYVSDVSIFSTSTYLLNTSGETIHTWVHQKNPASMPYLRPDSSIVYPYVVDAPSMIAGGVGGGGGDRY